MKIGLIATTAIALATIATPASASLSLLNNYTGSVGLSTSGGGSVDGSYSFNNNNIAAGSTVIAAYLYQAGTGSTNDAITLNGNSVAFGATVSNTTGCCGLYSARADVTSIVAPIVNGGPGGSYTWNISEANTGSTDGTILAIVYSNAAFATQTVSLLDGFASVTGDTTHVGFAAPINPATPGFTAELRLGDNFSCCGQRSTVNVNGQLLSENAGNNDDGQGNLSNGQLITIGDDKDPFSPALPSYTDDHERYNLVPFLKKGDTGLTIDTINGSQDDNIFFAGIIFTGKGGVIDTPEPGILTLFGLGLAGLAAARRRK